MNCYAKLLYNNKSHLQEKRHTHKLNINNNFIQHAINYVKTLKTWIKLSNIFLLYEGDGSPESFSSVPPVGFVEALVTVVVVVDQVVLVVPSVGGLEQLQIKNNNIIIKDEVVQKLNKPDTNYAGIMALVIQQPRIIIKFHSGQWKQGVGKYS